MVWGIFCFSLTLAFQKSEVRRDEGFCYLHFGPPEFYVVNGLGRPLVVKKIIFKFEVLNFCVRVTKRRAIMSLVLARI